MKVWLNFIFFISAAPSITLCTLYLSSLVYFTTISSKKNFLLIFLFANYPIACLVPSLYVSSFFSLCDLISYHYRLNYTLISSQPFHLTICMVCNVWTLISPINLPFPFLSSFFFVICCEKKTLRSVQHYSHLLFFTSFPSLFLLCILLTHRERYSGK
jgi:hypothetical protein